MKSSRWRWHPGEMFVQINGEMHYLWRAVVHEGEVLEGFITKTRDKKAALKFLNKAMRKHGRPQAIVTDKLRFYSAALKEFGAAGRQEMGRWLINPAEHSHLPFRRREWAMLRFRRMRSPQKFAASTPLSLPTSTRNATRPTDTYSRPTALPLSPGGAVFARNKGQPPLLSETGSRWSGGPFGGARCTGRGAAQSTGSSGRTGGSRRFGDSAIRQKR